MILDSYLIKYIKDEISIFENKDGNLEILKNNGEETQTFYSDDFWKWFKKKIEYKEQSLSFIVLCDKNEFVIDAEITIAKENSFLAHHSVRKRVQEQSKGLHILSFPNIEDFQNIKEEDKKEEITTKEQIGIVSEKNLVNYFRNETKSYKDE